MIAGKIYGRMAVDRGVVHGSPDADGGARARKVCGYADVRDDGTGATEWTHVGDEGYRCSRFFLCREYRGITVRCRLPRACLTA